MADLDNVCQHGYAWSMDMTSMNISIPESLRAFVEAQVRERGYNSASEYVRELIRDARERATKETELRELVQLGLEQLRRGESLELDEDSLPEFFEEVKARARKRLSRKAQAK
jgi:antitoxin ParD1/3/4